MDEHTPVLVEESLAALAPEADGYYVDATFGRLMLAPFVVYPFAVVGTIWLGALTAVRVRWPKHVVAKIPLGLIIAAAWILVSFAPQLVSERAGYFYSLTVSFLVIGSNVGALTLLCWSKERRRSEAKIVNESWAQA